jgi:hypothetical protein
MRPRSAARSMPGARIYEWFGQPLILKPLILKPLIWVTTHIGTAHMQTAHIGRGGGGSNSVEKTGQPPMYDHDDLETTHI